MQLVAGEVAVAVFCDRSFDIRHAVEVTQEDSPVDTGCVKTLISQPPKEATVTDVDGIGDASEVADIVIGRTTVDMVYGHTGRDSTSGSHPYSMGSKYLFKPSERALKMEISPFALCIICIFTICVSSLIRIRIYFSSVRINAHAKYATFAIVAIEGDSCFGAGADIAHAYVVKEEGRAFEFRPADDFKTSLAHSSRGFGCRRSRQG